MSALVKAISEMFDPEFTRYNGQQLYPTKKSIDRLTEKYGTAGKEDHRTVRYYLVEVELGVLEDIRADPSVFPAARMTYMTTGGRLNRCITRAEPEEDGQLDPVGELWPTAIRPWIEGWSADEDEWQRYAPVLQRAHGIQFDNSNNDDNDDNDIEGGIEMEIGDVTRTPVEA
ncbi:MULTISPECIES: hypothetical protein [unclassified Haloferax]|jgi:hypothetical protein|uniref:hypothetical protein n=1 Tax=unclassified Haloferax TaxID=2625095 RepID=UPI002876644F|nr:MULTISPECIES: hypothetical protein [unclassified Haloferax]MDS0243130.1 hypothetical protein [Haloferax sp. S2CR25]MDS0446251.1 hypothetical protein [Haloferax sp. S2CR25-2]